MSVADVRGGDPAGAVVRGPAQAVAVVEALAGDRDLSPAQLLMRAELSPATRQQWARRGVDGLRLVTLVALVAGLDGEMAVGPTGNPAPTWWPATQVHPGWDVADRRGEAALKLLVPPLREAAAQAGVKQPALARAAGVSYMSVVRLLRSDRYPEEGPRLTSYLAVAGGLGLELRVRAAFGRPRRPRPQPPAAGP